MCCVGEATRNYLYQRGGNKIISRNGVGREEEEETCPFLRLVIKHENSCAILMCSYKCSHL